MRKFEIFENFGEINVWKLCQSCGLNLFWFIIHRFEDRLAKNRQARDRQAKDRRAKDRQRSIFNWAII